MRFLLVSLLLCVGLTSLPLHARSLSTEQAEALIRASGMQTQIDQIPMALKAAGQQQGGLGAGIVKPLVDALRTVFNPREMQQVLQAEMIRQMDVPTLLDAMTWFNSAEARSILAAEQRLMEPAVMEKIAQAMDTQTVPGLTAERRKLLQEIDEASGATDAALDMMMNMQAAFLTAFSHFLMPDQATEFSVTLASFADTRNQYRKPVQTQLLLQQAVLMEPVSDAALLHLRDFARTPSGQKTLRALNGALNHTLRTMAQRIPAAVAQAANARQQPVAKP